MTSILKSSALAVTLALSASGAAYAGAFTQGSFVLSALTSNTGDLSSATSFTLSPATFSLAGGTGDFLGLSLSQADGAFDLGSLASFDFTDAGVGAFTASGLNAPPQFNAPSRTLSFLVLGSFTPGSDFTSGPALTADESFSLTQAGGAGTAISISATFFSPQVLPPPPPSSPEPVTISLFGAGLAALGLVRKGRK